MEFVKFKDILFDLINECDLYDIRDIQAFDSENRFLIQADDGAQIEVILRELGPADCRRYSTSGEQLP